MSSRKTTVQMIRIGVRTIGALNEARSVASAPVRLRNATRATLAAR